MKDIHERALIVAKQFKKAEADLITTLQEVDAGRAFCDRGFTSLFQYAVSFLDLSESTACNFIAVARKARDVPVLQAAIQEGTLTVSKARKITPVVTADNQDEWVAKARILPCRQLEQEVARVAPREAVRESVRFVTAERLELKVGISEELEVKLRRIQDLESQRTASAATLEDALEAMAELYLQRKDPVRKNAAPASVTLGRLSRAGRFRVLKRDEGRCTYIHRGRRCGNTRWLDVHHVRARARGGTNEQANLTTLCRAHHQAHHAS